MRVKGVSFAPASTRETKPAVEPCSFDASLIVLLILPFMSVPQVNAVRVSASRSGQVRFGDGMGGGTVRAEAGHRRDNLAIVVQSDNERMGVSIMWIRVRKPIIPRFVFDFHNEVLSI